ncbi:MAG TPA: 4'-phosphopantetheinyl transferase superfamily protein [Sphingobium sp.]|uniref:4'-phosphopantetheinyl transferase family protein n=1 Tax=Sphingobium sp. TaxID=1912891 RepID=UPI002ED2C1EE
MTEPIWRDGALDMAAESYAGPVVLRIALDSPFAQGVMGRASLDAEDYRDFAARADAPLRLARRRLAKALLGWAADMHPQAVRIVRSPLGAPLVAEPGGWHVSVAGQGASCLIGVARETIGVDIEPRTAPPPPLDLLTPRERARIEALPDAVAGGEALALWVAKEAHAKRIGLASRLEPVDIEVIGEEVRSGEYLSRCRIAPFGDVVAAVALGT